VNEPADSPDALVQARLLLDLGRPADALPMLRDAVERAPDDPQVHRTAALVLTALSRTDEAVAAARHALQLTPEDADGWTLLAGVLMSTESGGREAWDAAAAATRLAPDDPDAHATMGAVALALGHFEVAEAALRRVLDLRPGDAAAEHDLALALAGEGRTRPALDRLAAAVLDDPGAAGSRAALNSLWAGALVRLHVGLGLTCLALVIVASPAVRAGADVPRLVLAGVALAALTAAGLVLGRAWSQTTPAARDLLGQWLSGSGRARFAAVLAAIAALPLLAAPVLPAATVALLAAAGLAAAALGGLVAAT
jgi:tetratricopeptide (TPR) repeat protein